MGNNNWEMILISVRGRVFLLGSSSSGVLLRGTLGSVDGAERTSGSGVCRDGRFVDEPGVESRRSEEELHWGSPGDRYRERVVE